MPIAFRFALLLMTNRIDHVVHPSLGKEMPILRHPVVTSFS